MHAEKCKTIKERPEPGCLVTLQKGTQLFGGQSKLMLSIF